MTAKHSGWKWDMATEPRNYKVIETDSMTGNERELINYAASTSTFTREEARDEVEWRTKNITNKYSYEIKEIKDE